MSAKIIIVGTVAVGTVAGLLAIGVWASIAETNACTAAGGHIVTKSTSGIGVTGNGGVGPTFGTVSFCVSEDGRILD